MRSPDDMHGYPPARGQAYPDDAAEYGQDDDGETGGGVGRNAGDVDVVTFLHCAGERYKEHLRMLQRQRRQEEMQHVTGKPFVSPYAEELYRQSAKKSEAVADRLHRLHAKRLEKEDYLRKRRDAEQRHAEDTEISNKSKLELTAMASELRSSRDPIEVSQKFIADHKSNMQRLAKEAVERELRDMQPGPKISALASTSAAVEDRKQGQSVEGHLLARERERQQKLYEKAQQQMQQAGSFKPEITRRAHSLQQADVVDRLYHTNSAAHRVYDETYERECTFAPRTNHSFANGTTHTTSGGMDTPAGSVPRKASSVHRHEDPYAGIPVHLRLHENPPRSSKPPQNFTDGNFTGTPRISETSRMIVERKRREGHLLGEANLHHDGDLGKGKKKQRADSPSALETEATFTFHPQVSQKSKEIWERKVKSFRQEASVLMAAAQHTTSGSSSSKHTPGANKPRGQSHDASGGINNKGSHDDAANQSVVLREFLRKQSEAKKEMEMQKIREERRQMEMQHCTFKPQTPSKKILFTRERRAYEDVDIPARGTMWSKAKQAKLQQLRAELDENEVVDCTFRPVVHAEFPVPNLRAPNAPGVEVHLHRMDVARKHKDEAELRIAGRTPRDGANDASSRRGGKPRGVTVPLEFRFGRDRDGGRHNIASLRAPINLGEWRAVRSGLVDEAEGGGVSPGSYPQYHPNPQQQAQQYNPASDYDMGQSPTAFYSAREQQQQQQQQQQQRFYEGSSHHTTISSFHVQHPAQQRSFRGGGGGEGGGGGMGVPEPSPVDYVLSNHQAIMRALHGKGNAR